MLQKFFNHIECKPLIQKKWESSNVYKYDPSISKNESFFIDTPPPTVSGHLHMGHVFSFVQADIIARYKRMMGLNIFYPIGFDDNGLPTERLVEKLTGKKVGINIARDEFLTLCRSVVDESEIEFEKLFKSIALSVDWSLKYQTISKKVEAVSHASFMDLYEKGLIYKKLAPIYWDCEDKTALAQADIEDKTLEGEAYHILFEGDSQTFEIMTTRPELLPACVCVFFHPEDERYNKFSGTTLKTPYFKKEIKLLPDVDVIKEKGTGLVMCCIYGDMQDVLWQKRHNLPCDTIISDDGRIVADFAKSQNLDGKEIYLKAKEARAKIVEILQNSGELTKREKISHAVKCAERSGKPIEILNKSQWFVKILDYKQQFLEAVHAIDFHPHHMKNRLIQWIEGLNQDWCISRQRYFGIPVPIDGEDLVLDTWFTSSLTPQLALSNIDENGIFSDLLPFDMRPQAHEIIRTWAFYTAAKSYLHALELQSDGTLKLGNKPIIPWKNILLSGWCLAEDRTKMSKSKGNIITPIDLITENGSDAIRYWCGSAAPGVDTAYDKTLLDSGRKFVAKIWNCGKFYEIHKNSLNPNANITENVDLWLLSELSAMQKIYHQNMEKFEYSRAKHALDEFFWKIFCDNYLEFIKVRSYGLNANIYKDLELSSEEKSNIISGQQSAIKTVEIAFLWILKLYAPFCPFVTEELSSALYGDIIHKRGSLKDLQNIACDVSLLIQGKKWLELTASTRKFKTDNQMSMNAKINNDFGNLSGFPKDILIACGL